MPEYWVAYTIVAVVFFWAALLHGGFTGKFDKNTYYTDAAAGMVGYVAGALGLALLWPLTLLTFIPIIIGGAVRKRKERYERALAVLAGEARPKIP